MKFQEAGLSLKTRGLNGMQIGDPFFDFILKLGLEKGKHKIEIKRVVVFDGISLRSVDVSKGVRNRMTIKKEGKVSQKNSGQLSSLGEEVLDAGGKMVGIGSILQIQKIVRMALKTGGIGGNDGESKFKGVLKKAGSEIGEVEYKVKKFNSPKELPDFVTGFVNDEIMEQISGLPILITNAIVDLDLSGFKNGDDLLTVKFGENYEIGSRDHGQDVIVSAVYDVVDKIGGAEFTKTGLLSLNLGPFQFETKMTDRIMGSEDIL